MFKVLFLSIAIHHSPELWDTFKSRQKEIHPIHKLTFRFKPNLNDDIVSDLIIDEFQNVDIIEALEDVVRYKMTFQYSNKKYRIYFTEQATQIKLNSVNHSYNFVFKYNF